MTGFDKHDQEVPDPPSIPIRAGGAIKLTDLRDLLEVLDDVDEDGALLWISERALTFHGSAQ